MKYFDAGGLVHRIGSGREARRITPPPPPRGPLPPLAAPPPSSLAAKYRDYKQWANDETVRAFARIGIFTGVRHG